MRPPPSGDRWLRPGSAHHLLRIVAIGCQAVDGVASKASTVWRQVATPGEVATFGEVATPGEPNRLLPSRSYDKYNSADAIPPLESAPIREPKSGTMVRYDSLTFLSDKAS